MTNEQIYETVKEFTMTPAVRVLALIDAVRYVVQKDIPGDFVECGVWKGGSIMAMALTLMELGAERDIWLYDTFAGMPPPEGIDGKRASRKWRKWVDSGDVWALVSIDEVKEDVYATGYPKERFHFVKGMVEDTIPAAAPEKIALLRLDTDWYSSTAHELMHLYPQLSSGGVLIVDDYGHYRGARKAVDRFRRDHAPELSLEYVDKACRIAVKE